VQSKVLALLELAEGVINHLNCVALGGFVGSECALRSPRIGSGVERTVDNGFERDTIAWAATEQDESDGGAHAIVVPRDIEGRADGWVGNDVRCSDWIFGELGLLCCSVNCLYS
jgi:hypothetical protein